MAAGKQRFTSLTVNRENATPFCSFISLLYLICGPPHPGMLPALGPPMMQMMGPPSHGMMPGGGPPRPGKLPAPGPPMGAHGPPMMQMMGPPPHGMMPGGMRPPTVHMQMMPGPHMMRPHRPMMLIRPGMIRPDR
ncbi:hypothetical protein DPEC_G00210070 [Dallia pectoralis]|uniref:Uncharacterized protein n=1 Tax=Dallia pectoralis TaxID=75939 RepID=A0ACC2G645_DALPE|nr:hypothetical protein DPEC_G00210070 [Dallia pectoralis]